MEVGVMVVVGKVVVAMAAAATAVAATAEATAVAAMVVAARVAAGAGARRVAAVWLAAGGGEGGGGEGGGAGGAGGGEGDIRTCTHMPRRLTSANNSGHGSRPRSGDKDQRASTAKARVERALRVHNEAQSVRELERAF